MVWVAGPFPERGAMRRRTVSPGGVSFSLKLSQVLLPGHTCRHRGAYANIWKLGTP